MTGTIRINEDIRARGFFFIRGEDGRDYFGHCLELRGGLKLEQLQRDQVVEFVPTQSTNNRGPKANEIYPVKDAA